jgi:hypothetical protein
MYISRALDIKQSKALLDSCHHKQQNLQTSLILAGLGPSEYSAALSYQAAYHVCGSSKPKK